MNRPENSTGRERSISTFSLMGTTATLVLPVWAPDGLIGELVGLLRDLERRLSVNAPGGAASGSQVAAINEVAGRAAVQVDADVYELVKQAVLASRCHRDSFNALLGPVVKAWRIGFADARPVDDAELAELLALTDPYDVEFDDRDLRVCLLRPGMQLDLGAIAKGYAADRAAELLRTRMTAAGERPAGLIDLGGNVIAVGGAEADRGWRVGVQSPFGARGEIVGSFELRNASAVTSGVYERFLDRDGRRYHHLIDPHTGRPFETDLAGVTIVAKSSAQADLWATITHAGSFVRARELVAGRSDLFAVLISEGSLIEATVPEFQGLHGGGGMHEPATATP